MKNISKKKQPPASLTLPPFQKIPNPPLTQSSIRAPPHPPF